MVDKVHNLYQWKVHQSGGSAVHLAGITRFSHRRGEQTRSEPTSGNPYPEFISLVGAQPGLDATTLHIAQWLAVVGTTGVAIAGGVNPGLVAYTQKNAVGGTRTGSTTHNSITMANGLLIPTRLSCEHQGDAQLEVTALATASDGVTNPLIKAESVALPAAVTDNERFTLGPMKVGDVSISDHCRAVDVAFGIQAEALGACSDVYPSMARIASIMAVITFRGINPDWLSSGVVPAGGLTCTQANSYVYLRKRAAGGTFASGSSHIKLAFAGMATASGFDSNGNAIGETSITVPCVFDGTNVPITATSGVALPS